MLFRSVIIEIQKGNDENKQEEQLDQTVKPRSSKQFGEHLNFDIRNSISTL